MSASDWSELDGHEALVSELRANPPVAPERLRQRVLVVVPAAVVLAVGAALVHGFVNSGSSAGRPTSAEARLSPRVYGPATTTATGSGKILHRAVAGPKATQSKKRAFSTEEILTGAAAASAPQALD